MSRVFIETHPVAVDVDRKYKSNPTINVAFLEFGKGASICLSPRGVDRLTKKLQDAKALYVKRHGR